jgi:hypothetical protein
MTMKKIPITILFAMVSLALFGQEKPRWMDDNYKEQQYPSLTYFTGFAYGEIPRDKSLQDVTQQMKTEAQADLSKKIRLQISSQSQSSIEAVTTNGKYNENESFLNLASTTSNTEVVGMKTESYHDTKTNLVYAFAYVNKHELMTYFKSNLAMNIVQTESMLQTAQDLEAQKEKTKARQQCEEVKLLFSKLRYAQDMMTAIDAKVSPEDLQQIKIESLYNQLTQMQAQLAQNVYVYVESDEKLFEQNVDIISNKVKAELAVKGCSFVENIKQADFKLTITASTRYSSNDGETMFCYADVQVKLYDIHKQKMVYSDEITQKSGSSSQDKAGRKAMTDAVPQIAEKIKKWIE